MTVTEIDLFFVPCMITQLPIVDVLQLGSDDHNIKAGIKLKLTSLSTKTDTQAILLASKLSRVVLSYHGVRKP